MGKGAQTQVWFAPDFVPRISWAAVRRFELFHEGDNLAIDDLDVTNMPEAYRRLMRMHAGGYRLTMITLGHYTPRATQDDLDVLDRKIQEEVTRLIHFLYLAEISAAINAILSQQTEGGAWRLEKALPHVARALIKPREKVFFDILARLEKRHILHETAIGLQLPDATKEKNWTYCAKPENRFLAFQQTITTLFQSLDKTRAPVPALRGYAPLSLRA